MSPFLTTLATLLCVLPAQAESSLDSGLSYIMAGEEKIDDKKALEGIRSCTSLPCRAFRLYLQAQSYNTSEEKLHHLKNDYKQLFHDVVASEGIHSLGLVSLGPEFDEPTVDNFHESLLNLLIVAAGFDVPLWLVAREPSILNHDTGTCVAPFAVHIVAKDDFRRNLVWKDFESKQDDLFLNPWSGGSIRRTIASHYYRLDTWLIYGPNLFYEGDSTPNTHIPHYEPWSFKGPWNRRAYKEFQKALVRLKSALTKHYAAHTYLQPHAGHVDEHLKRYVCATDYTHYQDDPIYMALRIPNRPLSALKAELHDLTPHDWNRALSYAILNNYGIDVVDWLIQEGASLTGYVDGEPIVIKASDRPDMLAYLLKRGADANAGTFYGKTALFYAVQFQNLESVRVLLNYGADINAKISSEKDLSSYCLNLEPDKFIELRLKKVLGFTPLAYSFRYGSPELTQELVRNKATLEGVDLERLKEWVGDEERYASHMQGYKLPRHSSTKTS